MFDKIKEFLFPKDNFVHDWNEESNKPKFTSLPRKNNGSGNYKINCSNICASGVPISFFSKERENE